MELRPTVKKIFEQLNRMLSEKVTQGNIIDHNLEKGLGTERALRSLLEDFFPAKLGVAKGKVANFAGGMSRQCDVIIYDRLNCPKLFIDENENQIIPIEGVYAVIEVKTTLTKSTLTEAFENLGSVYDLQPRRPVRSSNPKIDYRPPDLIVLGFQGIQLSTLEKHYKTLNEAHKTGESFSAYSVKSPGSKKSTGDKFLVHEIVRLGEGTIHHSLNGEILRNPWGEYTLGVFLTKLLKDINSMPVTELNPYEYFNYHMAEESDFFEGSVDVAPSVTGECSLCGTPHSRFIRKEGNWRASSRSKTRDSTSISSRLCFTRGRCLVQQLGTATHARRGRPGRASTDVMS